MKKMLLLLLLGLGLSAAYAQQGPIKGKVTDETGQPVPGATITIKNTHVSTTTDASGNFQITTGGQEKPILVISSVGFGSQEVAAPESGALRVQLHPEARALNDVVVVGYGSQRRGDVTGAISSVKSEDIAKRPITQAQDALQGTTPGVVVTQTSGQPGASPFSVAIRGYGSISGNMQPLYVIDGYIGGDIESLSPSDIESMEILKDASATAIYGSRASNGVVLISTKKGHPGKARINLSVWTQKDEIPKELKLMNAWQFAQTVNTQDSMAGSGASFTQEYIDSVQVNNPGGTNWQKALQTKPWVQNYELSVAGGSDAVTYMASMSYLDQPGLILNQSYQRTNFRTNLGIKVNKKVDLQFNVYAILPQSHNTGYQGDLTDPFSQAFQWDPLSPIRDPVSKAYISEAPYASIQFNPIAQASSQAVDTYSPSMTGTGIFTWHILPVLTFTSNNTYSFNSYYNQTLYGPGTSSYLSGSDYAEVSSGRGRSYQNSNFLTFHDVWGDHSLTVTALYEQYNGLSMGDIAKSTNLSTYSQGYYDLGLGGAQSTTSTYSQDELQSFMGRINYSYKDRYILDATLRDDGSSHLVQKYATFPSFGLAWNIGKEAFMENNHLFSTLKLRGGYGVTGNQAVPAYATIPVINTGGIENATGYFFNGTTASVYTPFGAPTDKTLKWEDDAQADVGLDAGFLHGRLNFTADAYHKHITNLLYSLNAPWYNSGLTYSVNLGSMMNQGLEFGLGGTPVQTRDFRWTGMFTLSFNQNKLLALGDGLSNVAVNGIGSPESSLELLEVGKPLGEFYGYTYEGTWKTSEAAQAATFNNKPGDSKYKDLNGDGQITAADLGPIGNGLPKYSYGFSSTLTYKNFDLYFMLQGTHGNQVYSESQAYTWGGVGDQRNPTNIEALDMWTPKNQTNYPTYSPSSQNYINSSRWVYDASYLKLRNLSITYHLPQSLVMRRWGMSNLELYVSGQNLFTITKFPGYDPEVSNVTGTSTGTAFTAGLENGIIPVPRSYTFGVRAGF